MLITQCLIKVVMGAIKPDSLAIFSISVSSKVLNRDQRLKLWLNASFRTLRWIVSVITFLVNEKDESLILSVVA